MGRIPSPSYMQVVGVLMNAKGARCHFCTPYLIEKHKLAVRDHARRCHGSQDHLGRDSVVFISIDSAPRFFRSGIQWEILILRALCQAEMVQKVSISHIEVVYMYLFVRLKSQQKVHNDTDNTISNRELLLYSMIKPIASLPDNYDILFLHS